ncbi:putative suppressor protein SRP40-like isoform X2 [Capsicum annuum]|nr:putative suppressor protein SRP40-like isoform X2 [Capsicum annuum]
MFVEWFVFLAIGKCIHLARKCPKTHCIYSPGNAPTYYDGGRCLQRRSEALGKALEHSLGLVNVGFRNQAVLLSVMGATEQTNKIVKTPGGDKRKTEKCNQMQGVGSKRAGLPNGKGEKSSASSITTEPISLVDFPDPVSPVVTTPTVKLGLGGSMNEFERKKQEILVVQSASAVDGETNSASQPTQLSEMDIWVQSVGRKLKGRVKGLGSLGRSVKATNSSTLTLPKEIDEMIKSQDESDDDFDDMNESDNPDNVNESDSDPDGW